jgi:phosphoadenosine phosphosulfate reductase
MPVMKHLDELEAQSIFILRASDPSAVNPGTGRVAIEGLDGQIVGGGLIQALNDGRAAPASATTARKTRIPTKRGIATKALRAELEAKAALLGSLIKDLSPTNRLRKLREEIAGRIAFTTSFGLEDQVILHMLVEGGIDVDLVTLDTGRLFPQTYDLWAETEKRFGRRIRAIYPHQDELAAFVERQGINGFYESRDSRQSCCHIRKVEPLTRVLAGAEAWIAGLRAEQSAGRRDMALVSADTSYHLIKLNPLFDWTREVVQQFATAENLPVNPLHAKGFVSIGCAPCTRAIAPGEPERAGRWWWEDEANKECGLHAG